MKRPWLNKVVRRTLVCIKGSAVSVNAAALARETVREAGYIVAEARAKRSLAKMIHPAVVDELVASGRGCGTIEWSDCINQPRPTPGTGRPRAACALSIGVTALKSIAPAPCDTLQGLYFRDRLRSKLIVGNVIADRVSPTVIWE